MKPELPGFYYDAEKNRYFPIKGRIPGSNSSSSSKTAQNPDPKPSQEPDLQKRTNLKAAKLLSFRELNGNAIPLDKGKCNFKEEIQKLQASCPEVWRYEHTSKTADAALEHAQICVQTLEGLIRRDFLLTGTMTGSLGLLDVGEALETSDFGCECAPFRVLPCKESGLQDRESPWKIWRPAGALEQLSSSISSINLLGRYDAAENTSNSNRALITTLEPEVSGSVFVLNLDRALDFNSRFPITRESIHGGASLDCTIWTADCDLNGSHAAIGTNLGGALVDVERGASSWFLRSKSDVLALQFHQSGNVIQCGLRNGAIVSVDTRERPGRVSSRLTRHQIRYHCHSSNKTGRRSSNRQWFELKGNLNPSRIIYMPSSVTCLATLKTYDHYLMASSMDGSIVPTLDEAIRSTHDERRSCPIVRRSRKFPYAYPIRDRSIRKIRYVSASGGVDGYVRIWSIKSGQLLSENKISDSVPSVLSWPTPQRRRSCGDGSVLGAWIASRESIFYVR
ncbi:PREDICTED: uncharacterized protein LOC104820856 isoform X2 [Tarenaya hassleriana]|uniref:uncharacterized protein LOC104820856 isoform X2 n=1 Tax=Tarenaya hassleriana TaxID=28532 RepID=UPI00053C7032|nr:PREDICTED: uncharacterized protein LOC104820856 isoform X2 [Tarenaya hassleriana]